MENPNNPISESQTIFYPSSSAIRVPIDSSLSINFHFETQEDENKERVIQSFTLDLLDPSDATM